MRHLPWLALCLPLLLVVQAGSQTPVVVPTPDPVTVNVKLEGPTEVPAGSGFPVFVTAPSDAVVRWKNDLPIGAQPPTELTDNSGRTVLCFFGSVTGTYRFTMSAQIPSPGLDPFAEVEHVVVVGVPAPPVPPEPDPAPPTPPTPNPGKRKLVIVRESAQQSPELARVITALRAGAEAKYLKEHGHLLSVYDDDELSADWQALISGVTLPAVFYVDPVTNVLLDKSPVPAKASAVIDTLKANGG